MFDDIYFAVIALSLMAFSIGLLGFRQLFRREPEVSSLPLSGAKIELAWGEKRFNSVVLETSERRLEIAAPLELGVPCAPIAGTGIELIWNNSGLRYAAQGQVLSRIADRASFLVQLSCLPHPIERRAAHRLPSIGQPQIRLDFKGMSLPAWLTEESSHGINVRTRSELLAGNVCEIEMNGRKAPAVVVYARKVWNGSDYEFSIGLQLA